MTEVDRVSVELIPISTHILTKRMTVLAQSGLTAEEHFNSHPHEEDDHGEYNEESEEYISTHILTKRMTTVSFLS